MKKATLLLVLSAAFYACRSQESIPAKALVGRWRFCEFSKLRTDYKCSAPLSIYHFREDGTYTQSNTFGNGKYPFRGTWELLNDTLILRDSTEYKGLFSSYGVEIFPDLTFVNPHYFYSRTQSSGDSNSRRYHYFIRQKEIAVKE